LGDVSAATLQQKRRQRRKGPSISLLARSETASDNGLPACASTTGRLAARLRVVISSTLASRNRGRRLRPPHPYPSPSGGEGAASGGRKLGPAGIPAPLRASGSREEVVSREGQWHTHRSGKPMPIEQADKRGAPLQRGAPRRAGRIRKLEGAT